jgi:hypothetical protein
LDEGFYAEHGRYFHNQHPQDPQECIALLKNSPTITYLMHSSAHIKLRSKSGPNTHFRVFGSPFNPQHGLWAFDYKSDEAAALWNAIPPNTDILVTHTPPKGHCDLSAANTAAGCEPLRQALWRVRPKLHVCGHKHEGRGVERVTWDLAAPRIKGREKAVVFWEDPGHGNNKQSLVDLTRKGGSPLNHLPDTENTADPSRVTFSRGLTFSIGREGAEEAPNSKTAGSSSRARTKLRFPKIKKPQKGKASGPETTDVNEEEEGEEDSPNVLLSMRDDQYEEAIVGRLGRAETCIVNAAYLANSWGGPKRFNKPIVVDIELPVWQEDVEGEKGDETE